MPTHCCVPVCKQYGYVDKSGRKLYHKFPSDEGLKKKWIAAIKRDEGPLFRISKATKVWPLHFLETNFWENVASGHRLLKESAVPSIFPFRKTKPPRKPPRQRIPAIPASKKKCNELRLPADSQSSMELANAPDENQPALQEVVADQNVSP
ncbi:hypothetical protein HPB49_003160 [Dermacentor silvarum]|uniref:Uncharacterized protein n=1 Tax=Dermacentor silvarum TaxID=543639 RepID=A0ACB8DTL1_DERSI|nr:hypothetical protein HPB49_003160 [Dermacentor silvarum]